MGKFIFGDGTPKKILYNGVEVKKILFNNVEVWRKAIEAGSKSAVVDFYTNEDSPVVLSFTVPDDITKLKLTVAGNKYTHLFNVTPGESVNFSFEPVTDGRGEFFIYYRFNGSGMGSIHEFWKGDKITITVSWSEAINNS